MAEEDSITESEQTASVDDAALASSDDTTTPSETDNASADAEATTSEKHTITDIYFSNGNRLLTLPGSSLAVNDDTRRLLALFSDGRFLVVETHKFDGRVLSFEVLARKKKLAIAKPTYVSQNELNAIYSIGERAQAAEEVSADSELDQLQMQKDFVNVVARAAARKVSDIHVVVADSTTIMFRVNGMMQVEMEYNKEWGESFVRAAFASADISDSNYAQNEFQGAQKLGSTPLRGSIRNRKRAFILRCVTTAGSGTRA